MIFPLFNIDSHCFDLEQFEGPTLSRLQIMI